MRRFRPVRGVTLMEMIVVVGIILLLMGLAILSPRLIRTTRPELEAASLLYGTLMETRSQALRDGAYYRISISNNIFF